MFHRSCKLFTLVAIVLFVGACAREPQPTTPVTQPTTPVPTKPAEPVNLLPARGTVIEPASSVPADFVLSKHVEVYGNFHTAGVIVDIPEGVKAEDIATMRCYQNINGKWSRVHDLVQVRNYAWFATSLFWLKPDSTYQVKVEVVGKDDSVITTWYGQGDTRPEPALHESSDVLYVSNDGDDSAAGTEDAPFQTLAHAFKTVKAGQTIMIRGGTYYEGMLMLANKARDGSPIVIRAYPGEEVILDGSDPELMDAAVWQDEGDNVFSYRYEGHTPNACLIEKATGKVVRLFPVLELAHLQARDIPDAGSFEKLHLPGAVFTDGNTAYIASPGPLDQYEVRIPKQNRAIVLEMRSNVQIDGLTFNFYGKDLYTTSVFVYNSSDVFIQNCKFNYDSSHIYVKGDCDRLTIQDCRFIDDIIEWPFSYMKSGSGISGHFEGGAVNVDAKFSGRGLVFRRNYIENIFDGVHLTPWTVNTARTNEIDFYENVIDGCIDDFIEADGYSRNVRIFDNFMNRSLSGVSLAQALDGPTFVIYNVIANCGMVPAAQREENYGYPFKTNGGPEVDVGSGPMFFYHNTSYTLDPNSRALLVKRPKWKMLTMRNNIWQGRIMGFEIWLTDPSPMDFDYDNLYVEQEGAPLVVQAYKHKYMTLEQVREKFGWLKNGISADPKLTDPEKNIFTLTEASPSIDAGAVIAGINEHRMKGIAPDMGAYEKR